MKKKLMVFILFSFLLFFEMLFCNVLVIASLEAEELILKVKENPKLAGWIYQKGKLENSYCLYERNYMIFASANADWQGSNPILNIFKEHVADILSSSFSISNKRFVSIDSNGVLIERMFENNSEMNVRKVHEKLKPTSIAISPDDSIELVGFKNGFIQAHSLLKKTKKNVDVYFKAHSGSVYSISFNALGNYFASSGRDGKIKIWKTKDLSLLREVDSFINSDNLTSSVPALFSPINDVFVYTSAENMLAFSDIKGKNIQAIFITDGIKEVHFTEKKDAVAVLTLMGNLEFYSISKGKYLGTIPALNSFSISSLSINIITGNILVATKEGEIYLCTPQEIKNVRIAKKNEMRKDAQIGKASKTKENAIENEKNVQLSKTMLEYWGLEDGVRIQRHLRKPSFPIKDETPLEPPLILLPAKVKEVKKYKKNVKQVKTLNQTVFDEDIEFQPIVEKDEEVNEDIEDDQLDSDEASTQDSDSLQNDETETEQTEKDEDE